MSVALDEPIPASWSKRRLAHLVTEVGGATPSKAEPRFWDGDIPWVSPKDMKQDRIGDSQDHISHAALRETSLRLVPVGSTLIAVRGMILVHTVPVAQTTVPVTLNQDMKALVPRGIDNDFLQWLLKASQSRLLALVEESGHGTRCLRSELWKALEVGVPPTQQQRAIANFLDRKTTAIDALIEKKERLLALLAEKRAALIHQAVTKGLDPTVPMKPSDLPAVGLIPAHWEVKRLSWLLRDGPRNGVSPAVSEGERGVPSFSLSVVRDGTVEVREDDLKLVNARLSDVARFAVMKDDLLMVRGNGNINLVGRVGLVTNDLPGFVYPDLLMRMRCAEETDPGFLRHCINSDAVRPQLEAAARTTVGTFKVNNEQVRELRVLAPPKHEAADISAYLDKVTRHYDAQADAIRQQLARLREYRQALITAAVTGQLDIPDAA